MLHSNRRFTLSSGVLLAGAAALSACGPKEPPKSTPVVEAPRITVPPQPMPPMNASPNLRVPPLGPTGERQTINTAITPAQTTWNFRSAYNVAALNCLEPQHAAILPNYKTFLTTHAKTLTAANKKVDAEFKTRFPKTAVRSREAYMTQVYNFYALPPTLLNFCDAALLVSNEVATLKAGELDAAAARDLPVIDLVFENFYLTYEQYRTDLAAWQSRYAPPAPAVSLAPASTAPGTPPAPMARPR